MEAKAGKHMKWYKRPIRRDSVWLKKLRTLCEFYQIRVRFYQGSGSSKTTGTAYADNTISVCIGNTNGNTDIQEVFSTLFHEIGHCIDMRNNKYYGYNGPLWVNKKCARFSIRHGYQAEMHADTTGKDLMKKHFPNIPYVRGYSRRGEALRKDLVWYHKNFLNSYKKYLGER